MQTSSRVLRHGRNELAKVIVGQEEMINQCLLTILCGGHALLEGVPGIAKTLVHRRFFSASRAAVHRPAAGR